jgi:hypothetical protein
MERRASKAAYYLNRAVGYLALMAQDIPFPASVGIWVPVADAQREPWKVMELLAAAFPGEVNERFPFIALLTDHDVIEFEDELCRRGLLAPGGSSFR